MERENNFRPRSRLNRFYSVYHGGSISKDRLVGLSDGFIAIVLTLMVLEIPLPKTMDAHDLSAFGVSVLVYLASFVIVGLQWNRHHHILERVEKVTNSFVWKNLIYLFSLSLVPLLMKWIIEFPGEIIPAVSYALIYVLMDFCTRWIFISSLEERAGIFRSVRKNYHRRYHFIRTALTIFWVVAILVVSMFLPQVEIFFLIILPVMLSLISAFSEKEEEK